VIRQWQNTVEFTSSDNERVAINALHVCSVLEQEPGEGTRIMLVNGDVWLLAETYNDVVKAVFPYPPYKP